VRWFLLAAVGALIWLLRAVPGPGWVDRDASALLALGMIMIGGELVGDLAQRVRLPRISGYLILGMALGPSLTALVTRGDLNSLVLFEELALGLIALTAGGELRMEALRKGWRLLGTIIFSHAVGIVLASSVLFWLILGQLPFLGALTPAQRLAAVALLGILVVANSPATTIAIITETRSRGPLVDTVLGVTVVKDLIILLLFTWVSGMAAGWVGGGGVDLKVLAALGTEMVLSLVAGTVLGLALGAYLDYMGFHPEITVLALVLVSMELAHTWHLEHLLVTMAAGFIARNVFPRAATGFLHALERSSPPIYVVFFALVGAGLDLGVFRIAWAGVAVLVLVRLVLTWGLTAAPAILMKAPHSVRQRAWVGFVAQAGLTLGLAGRIAREFPGFGAKLAAVIVGAVVVNQLVGPVLWRHALVAAGEAGRAETENPGPAARG